MTGPSKYKIINYSLITILLGIQQHPRHIENKLFAKLILTSWKHPYTTVSKH